MDRDLIAREVAPREHEHAYQFKGTYYYCEGRMPGTGAIPMYLVDVFFCSGCLDEQQKNARRHGNSYFGAPVGVLPLKGDSRNDY